jgi:hypothetical protein
MAGKNKKYHLRKIVGRKTGAELNKELGTSQYYATILYEHLECGHYQPPVSDIYGETNAYRRRCRQCPKPGY